MTAIYRVAGILATSAGPIEVSAQIRVRLGRADRPAEAAAARAAVIAAQDSLGAPLRWSWERLEVQEVRP